MEEYKLDIQDIVDNELCTGCGICVSEDPENMEMVFDQHGFLIPKQIIASKKSDAIRVCPFNPEPEEIVKNEDKLAEMFLTTANKVDFKIGKFINTYVGYSNEYRVTSSSGGIATYIFEQLLRLKIVDYLFIVKEVNGHYEYQLFNDFENIKKTSKTRYIPVTLAKLFTKINSLDGKIAVSGVACFIKAIRLKQHYHPELKSKIPFLVGIICGGLKSKFFTDYLAQKSGIDGDYHNQDYRIKDEKSTAPDYSFGAFDEENKLKKVKMLQLRDMWGTGMFKSNACDFCDDVTTELADISLGDAWINPYAQDGLGNSVIVTRSLLADELILEGIKNNHLSVEELSLEHFKMSQRSSFFHRQDALKYRVGLKKKNKKLTPQNRTRFYKTIPIYFKLVQSQRIVVRKKSLVLWAQVRNHNSFDELLTPYYLKLKSYTKFYHRLRQLKNLILKRFS